MDYAVDAPSALTEETRRRWSELQAGRPALDSPFLSPDWALAVERAMGPGDQGVRVVTLRDRGAPVGFFPAKVAGSTALAVGAAMCDYEGLVAAPGVVVDPGQLARALGVSRLDFRYMMEDQASFTPYARGCDTSWIVDISKGYDAYAEGVRRSGVGVLKDLAKKRRKLARDIGEPRFTALSTSQADLEQLIVWKRGQMHETRQTDIFRRPWVSRLVQDLFERQDAHFGAGLFTLHFGGQLAAAHLHLRGRNTIHGWLITYARPFAAYSPGLLLFDEILRWMEGTAYRRLDLGAGDYRFKRELANASQGVMHGFAGAPSLATLTRKTAYDVRELAEALPLGRVSHWPGKAMRRLDLLRGLG